MSITEIVERERQRIERERQRFDHLALGRSRPAPELPKKPKGISKAEWKVKRAALINSGATLAPGIEEAVALRERWSHKSQGTPETHEAVSRAKIRPGSIARLFASSAIDRDQLDAADQIREAHRATTADVPCRTANWEMGGGGGRRIDADLPMLVTVEAEYRFAWWCDMVDGPVAAILAIVVDDVGLTIVAARYAISTRRMRVLLVDALDLWWRTWGSRRTNPRST